MFYVDVVDYFSNYKLLFDQFRNQVIDIILCACLSVSNIFFYLQILESPFVENTHFFKYIVIPYASVT